MQLIKKYLSSKTIQKINSVIIPPIQNSPYLLRIVSLIVSLIIIRPFDRKRHFGPCNNDTTYYVIGRKSCQNLGLFTIIHTVIRGIEYAINMGYFPIVDLRDTVDCQYIQKKDAGRVNLWEMYLEQPMGNLFSVDDIYASKNVILSKENPFFGILPFILHGYYTPKHRKNNNILRKNTCDHEKQLYKRYIRFNKKTLEHINKEYNRIISKDDRVLGLSIRGEFQYIHPKNHAIHPKLDTIIKTVKTNMIQWKCNKIFVSVEDVNVLKKLIATFGENVVKYTNRARYIYEISEDSDGKYLKSSFTSNYTDPATLGLDYLTDIIILSRCSSLISAPSGGVSAAMLLSNGYENIHIFECGIYGVDDIGPCDEFSENLGRWVIYHE